MNSTYSTGLSATGVIGSIISNNKADVRIVGRHPKSGAPKEGVPFSLDIEVETYRDWVKTFFVPMMTGWGQCPDAIVVVRSADFGHIWGSARIKTSMVQNCRGTARLMFKRNFIPDKYHRVVFELYPDGVDLNNLKNSQLIERSEIMTLDIGMEEGAQSGVYAEPTQDWYELPSLDPGSGLSEVNTLLKRILLIAGVGAGFYFASPFIPGIRDGIKTLASKTDSE